MAACSTVPHALQPPQRPVHFLVRQPQSAHRYSETAEELPMVRTVAGGSDIGARRGA
jgi:hypothetical protein